MGATTGPPSAWQETAVIANCIYLAMALMDVRTPLSLSAPSIPLYYMPHSILPLISFPQPYSILIVIPAFPISSLYVPVAAAPQAAAPQSLGQLSITATDHLARPNTSIHYPLFTPHTLEMPAGVLKLAGWERLTTEFPDSRVIAAILGICQYGARIGYEGYRDTVTIHPNLSTAKAESNQVTADITSEYQKKRLEMYLNFISLPRHYTASPLGLADKSDGSKRRIHHLSYPVGDPTAINNRILERYGAIAYCTIEEAIQAIQGFGSNCLLVKRDFESAFRHIPVSPLDTPLLGFQWEGRYYAERFLPFGLRTAPYIFNLFAEVFHWILESELNSLKLEAKVVHYLDDFLIVLPPEHTLERYTEVFTRLSTEVGLSIKLAKNEQGRVARFGGFELDTGRMVIRLPQKKLVKVHKIVQDASQLDSLTLLDIQRITGYLNFLSTVIPLGRGFLRPLYNMELYFPPAPRGTRRRLSGKARKDLVWWSRVLQNTPERSIATRMREVIMAWSDAASTKGLGAFYISTTQTSPHPESAFSIAFPGYLARAREHINTQEMRAVEQVLLR